MKIWLIKDAQGKFHPLNREDYDHADKIKVGEDNLFSLKRVRNHGHHRKYFAMIKMAFDNEDKYEDRDIFRRIMQMKAGYFDMVNTGKGDVFIPKSISFEDLDQDKFEELYSKVWAVLEKEYGFDSELFEAELAGFA